MRRERPRAIIALEDGTIFEGTSFGAVGEKTGEVVFNTSMTGYQEILTDPSYKGQIVTMTYPLIGNYGVNEDDVESMKPHVEGFIIREYSSIQSNWRAQGNLAQFLMDHGIVGIEGVDTRALTRHIRTAGAMKAFISTEDMRKDRLIEKAKASPGLIGRDLVKEVTCPAPYPWENRFPATSRPLFTSRDHRYRVIAMDFGIKHNILRLLESFGCDITVVPANTTTDEILSAHPDGILLSNGPGDPEGVPYAIETARDLIGQKPILGICLGHQILGLALGGRTYKMKFGHHGANHPVKDLIKGKVSITAQNHGFCVDMNSLSEEAIEVTHTNLNDQTMEGMRHRDLPIISIQFHPEASPGPHDARYLFEDFIEMMELSIR
ncbi:MAG: glutamine-hydrolyzing carbamoyl-phosphate synthase small subunit [Syntrophobacterales bacterium]|nr:MAG: glutamine-hydrolyzing carbamoyl-phosphate synthase small subunit [Syntrophobacterales bacterium]